ncbi:MAG: dethiobiotin synthase [Planctomycetota bacterium]|nr:MAG: dethiobiotin synthase [Planctomycetota bacterium]
MTARKPVGLFLAGTDTGVGKTYVGALIAAALVRQGLRVGVYKPAESGLSPDEPDDATILWEAAGRPRTLQEVCPQRFSAPLAPYLAAREEGKEIDEALLFDGLAPWLESSDIVLVEGAGGLMSPISDDLFVADLAYEFGFPLVIVARNVLGSINQTLQTLITAAAFRDGLETAGVVLNHPQPPGDGDVSLATNRREIERRSGPPVLAEVAWNAREFDAQVDWFRLAKPPRAER